MARARMVLNLCEFSIDAQSIPFVQASFSNHVHGANPAAGMHRARRNAQLTYLTRIIHQGV